MLKAMFRALGFSKKSAELRVGLLEKFAECERRGIDPFAEFSKQLHASGMVISLPPFPSLSCPLG